MTLDLRQGDCLELMKDIPDSSVNLVLMDPPYNIGKSKTWDKYGNREYIEFMGKVFSECDRVLTDNGSMYFFHYYMPTISELMAWIKENTGFLFNSFIICSKDNLYAKSWKNPKVTNTLRSWFNTCEYILYYVKAGGKNERDITGWERVHLDVNNFQTLRKYAYECLCYIGGASLTASNRLKEIPETDRRSISSIAGRRSILSTVGGKADHFTRYGSTQWSLPTPETYQEITNIYHLKDWEQYREYEDLRREYEDLRPVHNIDMNHNNVWKFKRDAGENFHPCQKPLNILERIIKCSTHPGMTVLDPFMGSGSTGVACVNTGRNFIGYEMDNDFFLKAVKRIEDAKNNK